MSDKVRKQSNLYHYAYRCANWSNQLGLHKISNPDPDDFAISLHRKWAWILDGDARPPSCLICVMTWILTRLQSTHPLMLLIMAFPFLMKWLASQFTSSKPISTRSAVHVWMTDMSEIVVSKEKIVARWFQSTWWHVSRSYLGLPDFTTFSITIIKGAVLYAKPLVPSLL